ncbi:SAM-dependent chlorinase/fluorinase [Ectothiorhodospiraceae bacterium 2226]|nr:SAM-dependent chlorinase/fluorinase [Ectothiorhodospiraceae bacterium 2226]
MIALFTDFGVAGPYVGQVKAVLYQQAPGVPVLDLFADAPAFRPRAAAHLLAAYAPALPLDAVLLCVVDPGVGDPGRRAVVLRAGGRWFVGPDNGLFDVVAARAGRAAWWTINWRPGKLSDSFHGRDLFAPVAALLARGAPPPGEVLERTVPVEAGADLWEVVYVDHYGNAITGIRAQRCAAGARLRVGGRTLSGARTFCDVPVGEAFWYVNANGLVEIAVNQGSAARVLGLEVGAQVGLMA